MPIAESVSRIKTQSHKIVHLLTERHMLSIPVGRLASIFHLLRRQHYILKVKKKYYWEYKPKSFFNMAVESGKFP